MMFKQKGYEYFAVAQKQIDQYIVQPHDELTFAAYARDGFRLIDILGSVQGYSNAGGAGGAGGNVSYLVDNEGFVRLPVIGELFVKGYTEKELQRVLADKLSGLFVDPFVIVNVSNRRAFLFVGSNAAIVMLNRGPTSLFEVLAKSGGIGGGSKAYKIKILRGDLKNPQIMMIDVSTLEGMRKADLIIQSNDIIYIEQKRQDVSAVIGAIGPYLSFVSTMTTIIVLAASFGKL